MEATEFQKWINIKWTLFYYMLILQYEKKIQELATKNHEKSRNIFLWAITAATTFLIILLLSNYQQNKFHFPSYITKFLSNIINVSTIDSILFWLQHTEKSSSAQNILSYLCPFQLTTHYSLPFFWCSCFSNKWLWPSLPFPPWVLQ